MKTIISAILLMALVGGAFLAGQRTADRPTRTVTVRDTDTVTRAYTKTELVRDTIIATRVDTQEVDTAAILADYRSRVVYDEVLKDDSVAYVRVVDTVHRNRLAGRGFEYSNRVATEINNVTVHTYEADGWYGDANLLAFPLPTLTLGVSRQRKDWRYGAGVGVMYLNGSATPAVRFSVSRRLSLP